MNYTETHSVHNLMRADADPGDPTPWKRVRREILHEIESGILEPGDELIAKYEAADRGICPCTFRRALHSLAGDGIVALERQTGSSGKVYAVQP
jgi:DNA-binding GntR family transcriptional regulator